MTVAESKTSTKQDPTLQAAIQALRYGRWDTATHKPDIDKSVLQRLCKIKNELSITESGSLLLRGTRIAIPQGLQKCAIDLAHASHLGIVKTKALIREKVWFSGIDRQVESKRQRKVTSNRPGPKLFNG